MEEKQQIIRNNLNTQIRSFSIDKEHIERLVQVLKERCISACDLELANLKQFDQSDEDFANFKDNLKDAYEVRMTVNATDGQQLIGSVDDVLNSPNYPEDIKSIYIASDSVLQGVYNYTPRNFFQIFFDFSKPKLLDFSLLPSQPTPNGSTITVSGYDATWANGVFKELDSFVKKNPSSMTWIHRSGVYDLLVWIAGLPLGFWLCYKLSGFFAKLFGSFSIFVQSAAYVYLFVLVLFGFLRLFHYARWVFPIVEFRSPRNKELAHRVFLGAIILGIISSVIWDICKSLF